MPARRLPAMCATQSKDARRRSVPIDRSIASVADGIVSSSNEKGDSYVLSAAMDLPRITTDLSFIGRVNSSIDLSTTSTSVKWSSRVTEEE